MADYQYAASGGAVVGYDPILRDSSGDPILDSNGQYIETDVSTHVRAVVVASAAGAVIGGEAGIDSFPLPEVLYAGYVGQGGAVVGYDPILRDSAGDPILDSNGQYIETDVSTHLRAVVLTPSGGAVVGGAAVVPLEVVFEAAGGAVVGGTSIVYAAGKVTAESGAVVGGTSIVYAAGKVTAESGAVVGGAADDYRVVVVSGDGGAVVGGAADNSFTFEIQYSWQVGDGGAVVGGESTFTCAVAKLSVGGAICGGAAAVSATTATLSESYVATGGAVCGYDHILRDSAGEPVLDSNGQYIETGPSTHIRVPVITPTAGAVVGGVASILKDSSTFASGGAVVGGHSITTGINLVVSSVVADGGAICGGTAVVASGTSGATQSYTYIAVGGLISGGSATSRKTSVSTSLGGAVAGGSAVVAAENGYAYEAAGGAVVGGVSSSKYARLSVVQGGAVTAGSARQRVVVKKSFAGGAVVSGEAKVTSSSIQHVAVAPTGGAVCGGQATVRRSRSETSPGVIFFKDYKNTEFYKQHTNTVFYRDETLMEKAA